MNPCVEEKGRSNSQDPGVLCSNSGRASTSQIIYEQSIESQ